jgi:CO/xanthine dehydrogenase Mo-binding subunit
MTKTHISDFTRRNFLKTGGALVIGFSSGLGMTQAQAARGDAAGPFDKTAIDTWIAVNKDNTVVIYTGREEYGQGSKTGLLQIAAEELDVDMSQISLAQMDTNTGPETGSTTGSTTIHQLGPLLRTAAAEARQALVRLASTKLGVQPGSIVTAKGVASASGQPDRKVTYGELVGDKLFNVKFNGQAEPKNPRSYRLVGTRVPRVDIPTKAAGKQLHMQHVRVPGMLHGRIVRPLGQRSYGSGAKPLEIDESSIKGIDAQVVRVGDFVGVVAAKEWDAVRAAKQLRVKWEAPKPLPGHEKVHDALRAAKTTDITIVNFGDVESAFAKAHKVVSATYKCPYQSHAPFAPNCAIADVKPDGAVIYSSTQSAYQCRELTAQTLGVPEKQVRVKYYEGSGTFGRSCYEDAAQAAAVMSQAIGKPVRVQFMRWDELGWDNYGPGHLADVRAAVDKDGRIVAYEYRGWHHGWNENENTIELARQLPPKERDPKWAPSIPVNRISTGSMYEIPNRKVVSHMAPITGFLRGAPLRSPLDMSYGFASDQTIDELAFAMKMDPYKFRQTNMRDHRWLGVLDAAAKAAKWKPFIAASKLSNKEVVTGRGIGTGSHHVSYGAAVADVEVNRKTGKIVVKNIYAALDAGRVVNPALVEHQIEGQLTQATSRVLHEEVTFDETSVTSTDWMKYPVLRHSDHPTITPIVVQRLDEPSTGAGEETMAAAAAAIANAVFDATGVRMRQYPMTPARVLVALDSAKVRLVKRDMG